MNNNVAITGIGSLSSIGKNKNEYWQALKNGKSGLKNITLFNTDKYNKNKAFEIYNFNFRRYFNKKGFFYLDRTSQFLLASTYAALKDSGLSINSKNKTKIGVVVGSSFGSIKDLCEFDKIAISKGYNFLNPSRFPNTSPNMPASLISVYLGIEGFNTSISSGVCSSHNAIEYAKKMINYCNYQAVIVVGVEELCEEIFLQFLRTRLLNIRINFSSSHFDINKNSLHLGEGAGALILENTEFARRRRAKIYGEILGVTSLFSKPSCYEKGGLNGIKKVVIKTLSESNCSINEVDSIYINANSNSYAFLNEMQFIKQEFRNKRFDIELIKPYIGETYSASGCLAVIAALNPLVKIKTKIDNREFNIKFSDKILINAFDFSGLNSSLVLAKNNA